jgi:transposase
MSWSFPVLADTLSSGNKASGIYKPKHSKPPCSTAFRQQRVELVAAGRRPSELAKEFGCHETSILSWVRQARAATPSLSNLPPTLYESERAE